MSLRGSCFCEAVCYEVDQLDMPIEHCHCVTCRKSSHCLRLYGWSHARSLSLDGRRGETLCHEASPGKAAPLLFYLWNAAYRRATVPSAYHPHTSVLRSQCWQWPGG